MALMLRCVALLAPESRARLAVRSVAGSLERSAMTRRFRAHRHRFR